MPFDIARIREKALGMGLLFHVCVTVPTILAVLYFGLLASDVYVSQSRFIVRSPNKPETTGVGSLLKTVGVSNSGDEIFAANDYLASRDALRELNQHDQVEQSYSSHNISFFDRYNPFGTTRSSNQLFSYFSSKLTVQYESSTSITMLSIRAYDPADAYRFNEGLLRQAEMLVNKLNIRARNDLISTAQREVDQSRIDAQHAAEALGAYRNASQVIDPEKQSAVQLQMVSKLQDELIASRVQLDQVRSVAANSSEIEPLQARIKGLENSIQAETHRVAGGRQSLSSTAVTYQKLMLDNEFADKKLTAALTALEQARIDAEHQQSYVERIVEPNLPDYPQEPHRIRGILATFFMGLIVWGILSMLLASLRDHVE